MQLCNPLQGLTFENTGLAALHAHTKTCWNTIQTTAKLFTSRVEVSLQSMRQSQELKHRLSNNISSNALSHLKHALQTLPSFDATQIKPLLLIMAASGPLKPLKDISNNESAIDWVNEHLQQHCLRSKNIERQDMQTPARLQHYKEPVLQSLRKLCQTQSVQPKLKAYDQLWILGAEEQSMSARFQQAGADLDQFNIQLKDDSVSIRTGDRPLWPYASYRSTTGRFIENGEPSCLRLIAQFNRLNIKDLGNIVEKHLTPAVILSGDSTQINQARSHIQNDIQKLTMGLYWPTEADLAKQLFYETSAHYDKFGELQLNLISAAMKPDGSRPTTEDVERLAAEHHKPGHNSVLVYSNQPHISRQELVLQNNARKHSHDIEFDTCGPGISQPHLGICVDELARRFYEASHV